MTSPRAAILAALLAAACAGVPGGRRPAHGTFPPESQGSAFERAVAALQARGDALAFVDAGRGILVTVERERPAPCGRTTCLAREVVRVRLSHGKVTAVVDRRLFDGVRKVFLPPRDRAAVEAVEAEAAALVRAIAVGGRVMVRPSQPGEHCDGDEECVRPLRCTATRCRAR